VSGARVPFQAMTAVLISTQVSKRSAEFHGKVVNLIPDHGRNFSTQISKKITQGGLI